MELRFRAIAIAPEDSTARAGNLASLRAKGPMAVVAIRAALDAAPASGSPPELPAAKDRVAFAAEIGCQRIVVHGGAVAIPGIEERLRHAEGVISRGDSAGELLEEIRALVAGKREAGLERVCRALHALCRANPDLSFGLLHAVKPHEYLATAALRDVLDDVRAPNLGVWADVGALRAAEHFGCEPLSLVLPNFASRLLGLDLHDALGLRAHLPPGQGVVDWKLVADNAPRGAVRILDLEVGTRPETIRAARAALEQLGLG